MRRTIGCRRIVWAVGAVVCVVPSLVMATAAAAGTPGVSLTSQASQPDPANPRGPLTDMATLSGGVNPMGTMVFTIFGPDDPTCAGTPFATSTPFAVFGAGTFTSDPVLPFRSGTYRWIATYSGDVNNAGVTTSCGEPTETVVVPTVAPQFTTQASPQVATGGILSDTASLGVTGTATGTITFALYGPDDPTCATPHLRSPRRPSG